MVRVQEIIQERVIGQRSKFEGRNGIGLGEMIWKYWTYFEISMDKVIFEIHNIKKDLS